MAKNILISLISIIFIVHSIEKKYVIDELEQHVDALNHQSHIYKSNIDSLENIYKKTISHIEFLESELSLRHEKIKNYENNTHTVTVTMYHPVPEQTDDTPDITADGTRFKIDRASDYKYVAVSRNMLKLYGGWLKYGDYIWIDAGKKSGVYQVRDTMHPRFVNYIDILETPGTNPYRYNNAKIRLVNY